MKNVTRDEALQILDRIRADFASGDSTEGMISYAVTEDISARYPWGIEARWRTSCGDGGPGTVERIGAVPFTVHNQIFQPTPADLYSRIRWDGRVGFWVATWNDELSVALPAITELSLADIKDRLAEATLNTGRRLPVSLNR